MEPQEFSDQFDVLYNNIMSNAAPGLDEYEKSVFLTKAQDEVLKNYFNPKGNKYELGFDGNEKRQIDFSTLIRTIKIGSESIVDSNTIPALFPLGNNVLYKIPNNILLIINESLQVTRNSKPKYLNVVPLGYTEYSRLMSKPYKRPLKNQAWRVITNSKLSSLGTDYLGIATIISKVINDRYEGALNVNTVHNDISGKKFVWSTVDDGENYYLSVGGISYKYGDSVVSFSREEKEDISKKIEVNIEYTLVELIPGYKDKVELYTLRYLVRPRPIILYDLEGTSINGETKAQTCELDPILHEEILQRAVELAKAAYTGDINSVVEMGKRSE